MKLQDLSFRQVALAVSVLGVLNWTVLQFAILPRLTEQERSGIYAGWMSTPYPYAACVAFMCAAAWYLTLYRGRYATHRGRIAVFAAGLGAFGGLLMILVIRITWHI